MNVWFYPKDPIVFRGKKIRSYYIWDGFLLKWPIIWKGKCWHGNVCGCNFHEPGYEIFNQILLAELVADGRIHKIPNYTKRISP